MAGTLHLTYPPHDVVSGHCVMASNVLSAPHFQNEAAAFAYVRLPQALHGADGDHFRVVPSAAASVAANHPSDVRQQKRYIDPPNPADASLQYEDCMVPWASHPRVDARGPRHVHSADGRRWPHHRSRPVGGSFGNGTAATADNAIAIGSTAKPPASRLSRWVRLGVIYDLYVADFTARREKHRRCLSRHRAGPQRPRRRAGRLHVIATPPTAAAVVLAPPPPMRLAPLAPPSATEFWPAALAPLS